MASSSTRDLLPGMLPWLDHVLQDHNGGEMEAPSPEGHPINGAHF